MTEEASSLKTILTSISNFIYEISRTRIMSAEFEGTLVKWGTSFIHSHYNWLFFPTYLSYLLVSMWLAKGVSNTIEQLQISN